MKLNKPEDVAAMLAAVNARARSWRPDNRRTRAEVTADQIALAFYFGSEFMVRGVTLLKNAVEAAKNSELLAFDIARRATVLLLDGAAERTAAVRVAEEYNASLQTRIKLKDAVSEHAECLAREAKEVQALHSALRAEHDKAAD